MIQSFRCNGIFTFAGVIVFLVLAIACTAPTPTPVPTPTPTPEPSTGSWVSVGSKDPMTDEGSAGIALESSESTPEYSLDEARLFVGCPDTSADAATVSIIIGWNEYLETSNEILQGQLFVDWRVDGEDSTSWWAWDVINDTGTMATTSEVSEEYNPLRLIEDLKRAEKITARVYHGSGWDKELTAVWYVEGFAEAYKPVEEACKQ